MTLHDTVLAAYQQACIDAMTAESHMWKLMPPARRMWLKQDNPQRYGTGWLSWQPIRWLRVRYELIRWPIRWVNE